MSAGIDEAPRVTVIVPARNEREAIRRCLDSIRAQTETRLQIIVVDGCSEDGTDELVKECAEEDPRVELLVNPQRTVPFALNIALAAARAPLLVRVDAHATVPPEYVARAAQLLETGEWGAVGGLKRGIGRTAQGRAVAAAMASRLGVGGSYYHYGDRPREVEHVPFGAYPARVAREVGGWGEEFTVNQDFEFDHRVRAAGHRILFDPALVIDWECRQSVRDLFRQYRRYGRGKVKVALRHPSSVSPRHLVPPALVGFLSVAVTGAALRRRPEWLLAATPYAGALAAGTWALRDSVPDARARVFVPAAFAAMHLGWGLGFWEGVLRQVRSQQ
jgi:glycosyltransferase involved in cell wall biosynthesis